MNHHDLGDLIRCTGIFTDSAGAAQDPTAVFCEIKDPSDTVDKYEYGSDPELKRSTTGTYYIDVDADEVGLWWYRFYSTGAGQAANEKNFRVNESEFD